MKRLFLAATAALCLATAACSTVTSPSPIPSASATALDEKALYAAEAAYNLASSAYISADSRGLLPADVKARAKPILMDAYVSLTLARQAYAAGNASTFAAQVAIAVDLARKAKAILPSS